jgi:Divergent InlB B-repeat domain
LRLVLTVLCLVALASAGTALARPAPVTWCGTDEKAENRVPDLELSSTDQVRVMYAVPSNAPDNFAAYASGIATDAAWIEEWWLGQDPSRSPRFDRYAFPGCGSRFGQLDIGFVRLPRNSAAYDSANGFRLLTNDLSGITSGQKTIAYFDGPVSEPDVCGQSASNESIGGRFGISFVYLQSDCGLTPPGSGTSAEVAAHELLHNLGALPGGAPHACVGDPGHPCDSEMDILYPYVGRESTLDNVTLDVNRDDYYAHGGGWWDVRDSDWLAHFPQFPLDLSLAGSGTLDVRTPTSTLPCEKGCTGVTLDGDLHVTAVAVAASGWQISRWSGACSGGVPICRLDVSAATSAAVTFVRMPARVAVRVKGRGRVTSAPIGIACTAACTRSFPPGTAVRLTATPARGWRFAGWRGTCTGRRRCTLPAAGGNVGARFARR